MERIAIAPTNSPNFQDTPLDQFPSDEVASIANIRIGKGESHLRLSGAYHWLKQHTARIDWDSLIKRLQKWQSMSPIQLSELFHLLHRHGSAGALAKFSSDRDLYAAPGPKFSAKVEYNSQAEIACLGLSSRLRPLKHESRRRKTVSLEEMQSFDRTFLQILRTLPVQEKIHSQAIGAFAQFLFDRSQRPLPQDTSSWTEYATLSRRLADRLMTIPDQALPPHTTVKKKESIIGQLIAWADSLDQTATTRTGRNKTLKPRTEAKETARNTQKRGHQP